MPSYSNKDIDARANSREIYEHIYGPVGRDGRGVAHWRGGTNPQSVAFLDDGKKWKDHGSDAGGGAINLVRAIQECSYHQACEWIGNFYGLEEIQYSTSPRVQELYDRGYSEKCRYQYYEATPEGGQLLVLEVVRLEHPEGSKTFRQWNPIESRWKGVDNPPLYREAWATAGSWTIVVEGEKDADTLHRHELPGTTAAGGSKSWLPRHSEALAGKHVVIIADHDEAGRAHALLVARSIHKYAQSARIITVSEKAKGDVTDYFDAGGTKDDLLAIITATPELTDADLCDRAAAKAAAKIANREPFRNYYWENTGELDKNGNPVPAAVPMPPEPLLQELQKRFCGAPYRCGESLFDRDFDTDEVKYLHTTDCLFAWIAKKSGHAPDWKPGQGYQTKKEFAQMVIQSVTSYHTIRVTPEYPEREGVFYSVPELPPPSPGYQYFRKLLDFFCPLDPVVDRAMLATSYLAPLYPMCGGKPMFVYDSERAGSGKTTAVQVSGELLGRVPIEISRRQICKDEGEITARLISPSARDAAQVWLDNVDGPTAPISEALSAAVTRTSITGRPKYGRGEVCRPNDLTYYMTVNGATLTDDLTIRSYFVHLAHPKEMGDFRERILGFVREHRLQILADMIAMLRDHVPFAGIDCCTRFPEFERSVLQAACGDIETYTAVVKAMAERKAAANQDAEIGRELDDHFRHKLRTMGTLIDPDQHTVFLRSQVAIDWARELWPQFTLAQLKQIARNGHSECLSGSTEAWPQKRDVQRLGVARRRGFLWRPGEKEDRLNVQYILFKEGGKVRWRGIEGGGQ